ncbi:hypothetical protein D1007_53569 [Hordeum vulgare]|nr:hypothetical protein D1007_53569 [Hordeum vulgare]
MHPATGQTDRTRSPVAPACIERRGKQIEAQTHDGLSSQRILQRDRRIDGEVARGSELQGHGVMRFPGDASGCSGVDPTLGGRIDGDVAGGVGLINGEVAGGGELQGHGVMRSLAAHPAAPAWIRRVADGSREIWPEASD